MLQIPLLTQGVLLLFFLGGPKRGILSAALVLSRRIPCAPTTSGYTLCLAPTTSGIPCAYAHKRARNRRGPGTHAILAEVTPLAILLRGVEGIRTYEAPATTLSIVLNPSPAPDGQLNPFSIPEIRRAFQFLVNREFVAGSIYRGMAVPMLTHVSPLDLTI